MRMSSVAAAVLLLFSMTACAHTGSVPARPLSAPSLNTSAAQEAESYTPVSRDAAVILGCTSAPKLPICEVTHPSPEEDSAFRAEAARLRSHREARCRELGSAIEQHREEVRMYRKALVVESGNGRMYGVGHTYSVEDTWSVRVARRIDDLNERSLQEKTRTLRHEMSHTLGASEAPHGGWSAEDYAARCG